LIHFQVEVVDCHNPLLRLVDFRQRFNRNNQGVTRYSGTVSACY
jgi:hypothetical protein